MKTAQILVKDKGQPDKAATILVVDSTDFASTESVNAMQAEISKLYGSLRDHSLAKIMNHALDLKMRSIVRGKDKLGKEKQRGHTRLWLTDMAASKPEVFKPYFDDYRKALKAGTENEYLDGIYEADGEQIEEWFLAN